MTCQFPSFSLSQGDGKKRDPRQEISVTQAYKLLCGQIGPWNKNINKKNK